MANEMVAIVVGNMWQPVFNSLHIRIEYVQEECWPELPAICKPDKLSGVWKNANVEMPILSTHELARHKNKLEYDEHEGVIRHKETGEETQFIQRAGVYFVKLFFPKDSVGDTSSDFGRPG